MTIFLDIDGTLLEQFKKDDLQMILNRKPKILPGTLAKLDRWHFEGYNLILTTARPEGSRRRTVEQLEEVGIYHYSQLIMNLTNGPRIVINDNYANNPPRAIAFALNRNVGVGDIDV